MKNNRFLYWALSAVLLLGPVACKDQLDIGNPNAPGVKFANENDLITFAQGGVYINGFRNGNDWLGNSYFSLPWGYSEILADNVGASASNNQVTTIGQPDYITLDDNTKVTNSGSKATDILRVYNTRASTGAGNNAVYYQWLTMYALNNAANQLIGKVDGVPFSGDAATKRATVKALGYWWKGYAYQQIGSMYYSGLLMDDTDAAAITSTENAEYVLHDAVIANSDKYFNLALTTLAAITSDAVYTDLLGKLIPEVCQVGRGGVLTRAMWTRNINTMLARNILINHLAPFVNGNLNATITGASTTAMSAADWASVKTLATNGVQQNDLIFTARSSDANSIFSPTGGTVSALTSNKPSSSTFKISERFIQNFAPADNRLANNWTFSATAAYAGDYTYTTRWTPVPNGNGMAGVWIYFSKDVGAYEQVIAGSYEENALMLAEAEIRLGNTDTGLAYVDDVRDYMGAGVPAVSGTGLTQQQAMTELVKERRVALVFRGLSFFDSRRWGWTYDITKGGGSYGNVVVYAGTQNTNVTFNYSYMDYWDVPADEFKLNPPSAATASNIKNPNF